MEVERRCTISSIDIGVLRESLGHERLKSSLAFCWPGMAVVSGHMASAEMEYTSVSNVHAFLAQGDRCGVQAKGHG